MTLYIIIKILNLCEDTSVHPISQTVMINNIIRNYKIWILI